jgi:glycine dehydrogenase subunit 1
MFIPHTKDEENAMLKSIGVNSITDLFTDIPEKYRFPSLNLPEGVTEMEVLQELGEYAQANETTEELSCFLGAGAYTHYIPAVVAAILRRGEFYTAYTPYQPEISQGTLQAIFEFQSLISLLTGMEVSNASHYDGATAAAEAGVMAYHHFRGKKNKIVLSKAVNPQYREVLCTYLCGYEDIHVETSSPPNGVLEKPEDLFPLIDDQTALVLVQYPDFFGSLHDLTSLAQKVHEYGGLLAVSTNPIALGLLKPPGEFDVDIVVGEGQPLGIPLSYGGPYLGFLATRKDLVRKISGRLVGETMDAKGRRGYVLTLTAREPHIRREKATSNICTNQGLMALAATVYLSAVGKQGLRQVANLCFQKAHFAAELIGRIPGYEIVNPGPYFHEFVVKCPHSAKETNEHLLEHGILGGFDLGRISSEMQNYMLIAVTEIISREEIELLAEVLAEVNHD